MVNRLREGGSREAKPFPVFSRVSPQHIPLSEGSTPDPHLIHTVSTDAVDGRRRTLCRRGGATAEEAASGRPHFAPAVHPPRPHLRPGGACLGRPRRSSSRPVRQLALWPLVRTRRRARGHVLLQVDGRACGPLELLALAAQPAGSARSRRRRRNNRRLHAPRQALPRCAHEDGSNLVLCDQPRAGRRACEHLRHRSRGPRSRPGQRHPVRRSDLDRRPTSRGSGGARRVGLTAVATRVDLRVGARADRVSARKLGGGSAPPRLGARALAALPHAPPAAPPALVVSRWRRHKRRTAARGALAPRLGHGRSAQVGSRREDGRACKRSRGGRSCGHACVGRRRHGRRERRALLSRLLRLRLRRDER